MRARAPTAPGPPAPRRRARRLPGPSSLLRHHLLRYISPRALRGEATVTPPPLQGHQWWWLHHWWWWRRWWWRRLILVPSTALRRCAVLRVASRGCLPRAAGRGARAPAAPRTQRQQRTHAAAAARAPVPPQAEHAAGPGRACASSNRRSRLARRCSPTTRLLLCGNTTYMGRCMATASQGVAQRSAAAKSASSHCGAARVLKHPRASGALTLAGRPPACRL